MRFVSRIVVMRFPLRGEKFTPSSKTKVLTPLVCFGLLMNPVNLTFIQKIVLSRLDCPRSC